MGFGDISAVTNVERVVTTLCMAAGATYYAYLVGSIASILEKYGLAASRRAAYRDKMVELHAFLNRHDIPYRLKAQMASYYSDVWIRSLRQTDDGALLRDLPHDLRCEVSFHIFEPSLRRVFRGAEEGSLRMLAQRLTKRTLQRGTSLFYDLNASAFDRGGGDDDEGENGGTFFIVAEGEVIVMIPTAAAAAEAEQIAAADDTADHRRQLRFDTSIADIEERDYRLLGVVKAGNALSYLGVEALVAGLKDPRHVAGVLRALERGRAGRTLDDRDDETGGGRGQEADAEEQKREGTRRNGEDDAVKEEAETEEEEEGGKENVAHHRHRRHHQQQQLQQPQQQRQRQYVAPTPPRRCALGVTRVTAVSTAEIYEISPSAAARLIAVERPDLLLSLIANTREELLSPLTSSSSSAAAPPAAVLERSLEVMTAVAQAVCGVDMSLQLVTRAPR